MKDETRQELLQEILENSPVGIAIVSGPGLLFRLATAAYQAMLPFPQMEIIGRPYAEAWPENRGFSGDTLIRQALNSIDRPRVDRVEYTFPDGLVRGFTLHIHRLCWNEEQGAVIVIHETTQVDQRAREIAEKAYDRADELEAIITAMAEAVTIYDSRGQAVRANPAAVDLFGIDPVGLDRMEMIELLAIRHPDGSPVMLDELPSERALRGETITGQRLLLIDNEDHERVVRVSASPLFDEVGVTAVVTIWHDVTEREHLLERLEIEQSRLETIITNAPEAILVADEEGRLVLGNPAAGRVLGQRLPYWEDVAAQAELKICYSDGTPYVPRNLPLTCSAMDGETLSRVEMQVHSPDGQVRYVMASTAPIVDRRGNLNGAVGVFQDITQRKQEEEALRRQASRSQLLASLARAFAEAGLNYRELLDTIVRQTGQGFGDLCSLHLFTDDGQWFYPAAFYSGDADEQAVFNDSAQQGVLMEGKEDMPWPLFQTGQPFALNEVAVEHLKSILPGFHGRVFNTFLGGRANVLLVPMRAHGRWVGVLNLLRMQPGNIFTAEDQAFLQDLADRAALAIEDSRLYERESRRASELLALNQATTALLSTIDLESLLAKILDAAHQAIPAAEQGLLYLLEGADNQLQIRAAYGLHNPFEINPELARLVQRSVQEKRPEILDAVWLDSTGCREGKSTSSSAILVPLILPEPGPDTERVLGVLALFGPCPNLFTGDDLRLLNSFAATATAALQNATLYAEVQRLATTDTVTEQYNRRKFFELGELEMHRFRRFHNPLSAIMLDLDNFKDINDTFGHASGDQVLRIVAQRCRASIRVVDILGRYGGDEFAILLPGAELPRALEIAERIRQTVTQTPIHLEQGTTRISISLGVTQASLDMDQLSTLLGRADAALYAAKQSGRNRVVRG